MGKYFDLNMANIVSPPGQSRRAHRHLHAPTHHHAHHNSSQLAAAGLHLAHQFSNARHPHTGSCSSRDDDSLSSISMLSTEQSKRKVRWILSLGLLLPALAAIIGK